MDITGIGCKGLRCTGCTSEHGIEPLGSIKVRNLLRIWGFTVL